MRKNIRKAYGKKSTKTRNVRNTSNSISNTTQKPFRINRLPSNFSVGAFASGSITNAAAIGTGDYFGLWHTKCGGGALSANSIQGSKTLPGVVSGATSGIWNILNLLRVKVKIVVINKEAFNTYVNIRTLPSASFSQFSAANILQELRDVPGTLTVQLQKAGSTGDTKTVSFVIDIAKLEGVGPQTILDGDYSGNSSTSPTAMAGLYLQMLSADGVATLTANNGMIWNISYDFFYRGRSQSLLTSL
jgi:hypothetical protein